MKTNKQNNLGMGVSAEKYVLAGMLVENEAQTKARICEIIRRTNTLDYLLNGVPVRVDIKDAEGLLVALKKNRKDTESVEKAYIDGFDVRIKYKYLYRTLWCKTEEVAAKCRRGSTYGEDYKEAKSDEYCIEAKMFSTNDTSCPEYLQYLEIEYL